MRVRVLWLVRMLGVSQGNGCHRNVHQSVLSYHSTTANGGGGGGLGTSGDEAGWSGRGREGGLEQSWSDGARLKGH